MVYSALGEQPLGGITAHWVRGAAALTAFDDIESLAEICRAATWSSIHSFTKHYRIDVAASAKTLPEESYRRVWLSRRDTSPDPPLQYSSGTSHRFQMPPPPREI